jgi:DNA-binding MarR family transcriptional regulator
MTLPSQSERARALRRQRERISAELAGVENGVLPLAEATGTATPREVAGQLGMSLQAANNALSALWRAGLLDRERTPVVGGGRAYVYMALKQPVGNMERQR